MDEDDEKCAFHMPEMEFDMWEGQFDFVGPQAYRAPPYGTNGVKKIDDLQWCCGNDNVGLSFKYRWRLSDLF